MISPALIVGLGNVGDPYADTRHNAGFWWIDELARQQRLTWRVESKFHGEISRLTADNSDIWLLKPHTLMNRSGLAIAATAKFYKIVPEAICVVHDELDLDPGVLRLKQGGGHGGHNGLRDTISALNSPQFWRLRLGIGHPGDKSQVVNFVLHRPSQIERQQLDEAIHRSLQCWPLIQKGDYQSAMRQLHSSSPSGS